MSDLKRFDDYQDAVDCNDCSHYWDSSCDGVSKGSKTACSSFLATRSVVIPERLNSLEKRIKRLTISTILVEVAVILHLVSHLMGWA